MRVIMKQFLRLPLGLVFCFALAPVQGSAQDNFFDSNGVRIRYVDRGAGEPVVLIHGGGSTLESWVDSGVLPNLAKDYRVIALDARGFGKSGKPHDVKAYGPEMGLDVIRLLDHLGIQRAHVVGYSMGAHITAQLLTTHPQRFLTANATPAPQLTPDVDRRERDLPSLENPRVDV
jgi:pimeloyl-ACP methyl ester carboxylesterase